MSSPSHPLAFDDVLAHFLQEEERGSNPEPLEYLRRYPGLASELAAFFCDRAGFDRAAARVGLRAGPPRPDRAGTSFGGYELRGVLGAGGMGVVYHAWQRSPGRDVALKLVRTDLLHGANEAARRDWLARFRREAELLASLGTHPGIVPLFDF